ncbi:hypothetical protein Hanom_Chr10g00929861 [Helianthus anomalus]
MYENLFIKGFLVLPFFVKEKKLFIYWITNHAVNVPLRPFIESGDNGNDVSQPVNRLLTPLISDVMDPVVAYFFNGYASSAYYYGDYDGDANGWDDYSRYVTPVGASHVRTFFVLLQFFVVLSY